MTSRCVSELGVKPALQDSDTAFVVSEVAVVCLFCQLVELSVEKIF